MKIQYYKVLADELKMRKGGEVTALRKGDVFYMPCRAAILRMISADKIEPVEPLQIISQSQDEIVSVYLPGTLDYITKHRPTLRKELDRVEMLLNEAALSGENILPLISRYKALWLYGIDQHRQHKQQQQAKARERKATRQAAAA